MTKKSRNVLIILSLISLVFLGILSYGAYSVYRIFSDMNSYLNKPLPSELKEAKVLTGKDFLVKKEIFTLTESGYINTISEAVKIKDEKQREAFTQSSTAKGIYGFSDLKVFGNEIIAVGKFGGFVFDLSGKLKREFQFEPSEAKIKIGWFEKTQYKADLDNLKIVSLTKDKYGFLSHGLSDGATVFDENGKIIWNHGKENFDLIESLTESEEEQDKSFDKAKYVLEATVGDLDNDGTSEFIVSIKNIGIQAFNQKGEKLWLAKEEYASNKLVVTDLDNDGKNELIELGVKILDKNGKVTEKLKSGSSSDSVFFAKNEKKEKILQYCSFYSGNIRCKDYKDNIFFNAKTPLGKIMKKNPKRVTIPSNDGFPYLDDSLNIAFPKAVWVKLEEKEPAYLAVVGTYIGLPRANFYLYTPNGKLVYHELLPEEAETIAVLPKDNELEEILIGGKDTIWKFTAK